jgi:hypothetical protein
VRERFTVHHHKKWRIKPDSINLNVNFEPLIDQSDRLVAGSLHRKFKFTIKTPKTIKWDRRDMARPCTDTSCTPSNVGDPFIVWGYTPLGGSGPDTGDTNLQVNHFLRARIEISENNLDVT